ncbi:MAG: response regulator [Candidatus Zambryskibacteria bacterium]|nr:response regulator [Candidatus Zambryskibacteria bacterium]
MKKILLIEDDVFLGDVLLEKLKKENYEARLSRDGKEGFELIKEFKPDLLLLDIILPGMNGYEILEAKQKDPKIKDIPVIIISNSGQPVEINRALTLGVKDYFIKAQFDPEEVMIKVRTFLKNGNGSEDDSLTVEKVPPVLRGKKIMAVEDDNFLSDIIVRKLSSEECVFTRAEDAEKALSLLENNIPDLILLDILLPGMNGFKLLERIKSDDRLKDIPVILLSNLGQEIDIEQGKKLGAKRFLVKASLTLDEVIDQIKQVLAGVKKV